MAAAAALGKEEEEEREVEGGRRGDKSSLLTRAKRVQKAAGGSEAWHREQEARKDLDFVPKKVRKRSISPFPSGKAAAQSGVPSQATLDLDAFLDAL